MPAISQEITANQNQMETWAQAAFPDLFPTEKQMVRAACMPEFYYCGPDPKKDPRSYSPEFADQGSPDKQVSRWDHDREVRGEVIRWLAVDPKAKLLVDPKGVQLFGAKI